MEREQQIRASVAKASGYSLDDLRWCLGEIDRLKEENKKQGYLIEMGSKDLARIFELRKEVERLRGCLNELARWDIDPKYLANGHDEVARKTREALGGKP